MRDLERNRELIYHSKRHLTSDGVEYFDEPVALSCSVIPISSDYTALPKGQVAEAIKKFTLSKYIGLDIPSQYDRFYVDTIVDTTVATYTMADNADYVVVGVEDTLNYVSIILRRLQS